MKQAASDFDSRPEGRGIRGPPHSRCNELGNASQKNIVDTAIAAGNFKTLTESVNATGLVETLSGPDLSPPLPLQMKPFPR